MESIVPFYTPQMQNGEVMNFHSDTLEEMDAAGVGTRFPERMETYRASAVNLKRTFDVFAASELSAAAQKLDARRDRIWSSFKAFLKICLNEDDMPETTAAAERVMFTVRSAVSDVGDPLSLGMTAESAAIDSIVRSLEAVSAELEQTGAKHFVEKLAVANREFMAMQRERDAEKGGKPSGDMKAARATVREAYRELVADINAQIRLHPSESAALVAFVQTHNATIEKHRNIVARRKGRKEVSPETPAP